ncbi:biotin--[acetyl-CoA-carboxylase] ligase [Alphaproteobacteria bacterium]|nr:biotin--[acetyl-CoA-carboxylase] ligase [Alphaproteobacteria bacterium]
MQVIKFNIIDSTHSYALKMINEPETSECAIIADQQTKGIGRCNRKWISDRGNLFVSIIKWLHHGRLSNNEIHSSNVDVGKISLTIACAVRDTIAHFVGDSSDLTLHWPNDVYHKNRKISGILIAVAGEWMVISVGINVNSAPNITLAPTSLKDIILSSNDIPPMSVFNILIASIDKWLLLLEKSDFSCIRSYWLRNINGIKCNVVVKNGMESVSGLFYDLDESGRLILEKDGEYLFISSGDLFLNQEGIVVSNEEN